MDFYGVDVETHLRRCSGPSMLRRRRDSPSRLRDARTVGDVIRGAGFAPGETRIDDLQTQATSAMYRDFENFNLAFSPLRSRELAKLFFSQGVLGGKYLRDIVKRAGDKAAKLARARASPSTGGASWCRSPRSAPTRTSSSQSSSRASTTSGGRRPSRTRDDPPNFFGPLFAASRDPAAHPRARGAAGRGGASTPSTTRRGRARSPRRRRRQPRTIASAAAPGTARDASGSGRTCGP